MNKQSYLDSKQLQTECNECIKILNSELLEIEKVSNNIKLVLNETGLKGDAILAYKEQLKRYFEIFAIMKEADKFDIIDYSKLKADATKTYDGDLICTSYERAKSDRDRYQSKANDERSKAASFNTTVTTLLPGGKVLVEHIPNPYESSAREYQNLADDCQKEMNLWHSKMEEFDAIEARTAGLFIAGKNKRTIAKLKLRTINKTPISRNRTLPGVGNGIGALIYNGPGAPKTTINKDVLKGAQILADELRKMKNEDGTPKYTEQEIKEMVDYVIGKYPSSLTALFYAPDQYKAKQMELCIKYAFEPKSMSPVDRGALLFENYLRSLTNEDGTPMYTDEEIEQIIDYLKRKYPNLLADLDMLDRNGIQQFYPVVLHSLLDKITTTTEDSSVLESDVYIRLANSQYSDKAYMLASLYIKMEALYGREIAIGFIANAYDEGGSPGLIEDVNYASYWNSVPDEVKALANTRIDSREDVELLLQYIPDGLPGVGIGMIQWSGSRRVGLLEYYRDNAIFYTEEELRRLEFEYMIAELSGDSSIAPENHSRIIGGCEDMSSEEAAAYIWANYEVSGNSSDEGDRREIARNLEGIL